MTNIDEYNREAEKEHCKYTSVGSEDFYDTLTGTLCGIIMILATIVGLVMLFSSSIADDESYESSLFWLAWPIGSTRWPLCAQYCSIFARNTPVIQRQSTPLA